MWNRLRGRPSERTCSAQLFFVLTLLAYVHYTRRPTALRFGACVFIFAIGLTAKAMLVTVPFVMLLMDFWPLDRLRSVPWRRLLLEKLAMLPLIAASSVITYLVQKQGGSVIADTVMPLDTRLANAILSYVRYIGKAFWPSNLSVYYMYYFEIPATQIALAVLALVGVTVLSIAFVRRAPWLLVGWFLFLGMLVPVIGIVQVGTQQMANRYMYLPLIGLSLMLVYTIDTLLVSGRLRTSALIVSLLLSSVMVYRTRIEVGYWRDPVTLFSRAIEIDDRNIVAHHNLADEMVKQGNFDSAIRHEQRAIELQPRLWRAYSGIGLALAYQGKVEEAQPYIAQSLAIEQKNPNAYFVMGYIHGLKNEHKAAIENFRRSIEYDPTLANAHYNLAVAYLETGQKDLARQEFLAAARCSCAVCGTPSASWDKLALNDGDLPQAIASLSHAIELEPGDVDAHQSLWVAYLRAKNPARSIDVLRRLVNIAPDLIEPRQNLAWMLATAEEPRLRNGEESLRLAEEANLRCKGLNPAVLDTLAVARAEAGDFPGAIETANKALVIAQRLGATATESEIKQHLDLFQRGEPVRDRTTAR